MRNLLFWEVFVFLFPFLGSTTDIDPCVSYQELRESHRSQFFKISALDSPHCDRQLKTAWYRFKGKAGLKMPEKCVSSSSCGTHAPGWFNGSHPIVPGEVSSGQVCFNWIGSCCQWPTSVRVKNCDWFYIYELPKTPLCELQYCGDGAKDPDCATDNNDISIDGSVPGVLVSPKFSDPARLQCTWRISVPSGMKVRLTMTNITLGSNDYIVLLDGLQDNSKELARFADSESGVIQVDSMDRYLLVSFVSNGSSAGSVFRLEYTAVYQETTTSATTSHPSTVTTTKEETKGTTSITSQPPSVTTPKQETKKSTTASSEAPSVTTTKQENTEKTTSSQKPSTVTTGQQVNSSMDVTCDKNEISVMLQLGSSQNYIPESVGLNDASCKPSFQNRTHIFFKYTLEDCGTTSHESMDGKMIVYHNAIHLDVKSKRVTGFPFTRDHQAVFEFQCRFKKRAVLSSILVDHAAVSKLLVITDIQSFGNFTFEMKMFKSGLFKEPYTDYPVGPMDIGSKLFLQVSVKSNDSGLVVLAEECKGTPSPEYDDDVHYTFIEDGCSKDSTLQYNYTLSAFQRFSLSAFNFRSIKSSEIFLHCKLKACLRSDPKSRCAEGCPFGKRKKRDLQNQVDRLLAIGPIVFSQKHNEELIKKTENEAQAKAEDDNVAFAVVAGVLGFIALLLLAALLSIFKSRGTQESNGVNVHLVRDGEPEYG
ncbi:ZP domain-containing protein-like isoform X2 [Montipora capricornis]|uniref:ZP domain-containing protein-like isoform X2 n=1 Tax=Montipora foliosa TaxID=591990 RepID=UPI0035F1E1A6